MKDKVLTEIADFCETCSIHDCCGEDECVLYRIEQLINTENYKVEIIETLSKVVEVEATSKCEAVKKVFEMYRNSEIVLTPDDYVNKKIKIFEGGN